MLTMFSMRRMRQRGLLAWTVVIEPSWPVFIAWSMSIASPPRHFADDDSIGPHTKQFFTRSRWVTSPLPSMFGGRVSKRTTCLR